MNRFKHRISISYICRSPSAYSSYNHGRFIGEYVPEKRSIKKGYKTYDIGGDKKCSEVGRYIKKEIEERL